MGSFHEIKDKITLVKPETVRRYYEFKKEFLEFEKRLVEA